MNKEIASVLLWLVLSLDIAIQDTFKILLLFLSLDEFELALGEMQGQLQTNLARDYADEEYMVCLNNDIETFSKELRSKSNWNRKGKKMAMNM